MFVGIHVYMYVCATVRLHTSITVLLYGLYVHGLELETDKIEKVPVIYVAFKFALDKSDSLYGLSLKQ